MFYDVCDPNNLILFFSVFFYLCLLAWFFDDLSRYFVCTCGAFFYFVAYFVIFKFNLFVVVFLVYLVCFLAFISELDPVVFFTNICAGIFLGSLFFVDFTNTEHVTLLWFFFNLVCMMYLCIPDQ